MKIPEISREELESRYEKIKPLILKDGGLYYIKRPDSLTSIAYTWDPKPTNKAECLEPVTTIKTLHTYGYYGMFKPSVGEVLSQIPGHLLDTVCAFHLRGPQEASHLNQYKDELNEGFQVAFATLYKSTDK